MILSGHDVSDGGLLNTLCEMSFSSGIGMDIDVSDTLEAIEFFFNEELGVVIEVDYQNIKYVAELFEINEIMFYIGGCNNNNDISIIYNNELIFKENIDDLRFEWQKTSYYLEKEQCNKKCVDEEVSNMLFPVNKLSPFVSFTDYYSSNVNINKHHKVCILREEGTNGDRELAFAFNKAGFECYDVKLDDILSGKINLQDFRGMAFPGGFSYSDVLGSAMGWYSVIKNNEKIWKELDNFYKRDDTFSIGICNGCQLMSLKNGFLKVLH